MAVALMVGRSVTQRISFFGRTPRGAQDIAGRSELDPATTVLGLVESEPNISAKMHHSRLVVLRSGFRARLPVVVDET